MQDDVRTIFISGFPPDVRDRELHNLLRYIPGYEACQMNWKTGQPQGFALFTTPVSARFAVDLVTGAQFDEATCLRAEMARKNMYVKADDPSVKRASRPSPLMPPAMMQAPMSPTGAGGVPGGAPPPPGAGAALFASPLGSPAGVLPMHVAPPLRPQSFSPVTNLRDNPPCNTLFIGNLGDNVSEAELRALMGTQPGYRQMKVVKGPRSTTAFVEFTDVASAMLVHQTMQGVVLHSSDRGGVRIQYSKNPFGRRDETSSDPGLLTGPPPAVAAAAHAAAAQAASAQAPAPAPPQQPALTILSAAAAGGNGGNGGLGGAGGAAASGAAAPVVPLPVAGWQLQQQQQPGAAAPQQMAHAASFEFRGGPQDTAPNPPSAAGSSNNNSGGGALMSGAGGG